MLSAFGQMLRGTCAWCTQVARLHARIHEIFLRIRIRGSIYLTNGSGSGWGSGSFYFRQWPKTSTNKCLLLISKMKSHKEVTKQYPGKNQCFSYYFCLMIEGSGSVPLTNRSGFFNLRYGSGSATLVHTHGCAVLERMLCASTNVTCAL
jgi:hypothetical protein